MAQDKHECSSCNCGCGSEKKPAGADENTQAASSQAQKLAVRRQGLISEFWGFMRDNKAYWMAPIIIVSLLLIGLLVLATISPAAATFIYTTF